MNNNNNKENSFASLCLLTKASSVFSSHFATYAEQIENTSEMVTTQYSIGPLDVRHLACTATPCPSSNGIFFSFSSLLTVSGIRHCFFVAFDR